MNPEMFAPQMSTRPSVLVAHSPDSGLFQAMNMLDKFGIRSESRNGPVVRMPHPVITEWAQPGNRVSFLVARDANPFFHYLESMWMLAGRQDVSFPAFYAAQIREYSDDGVTLAGAYGYRWRNWFSHDQIKSVISQLRKDQSSRRIVIGMWDPNVDPDRGEKGGKDLPCNDLIFFDVVNFSNVPTLEKKRLNMTVCCRSNDAVWGATGANAVHFSVLLEYVSAMTGIPMGSYYQVSNNFHVYTEVPVVKKVIEYYAGNQEEAAATSDPYSSVEGFTAMPLFVDFSVTDEDRADNFENILVEPVRQQRIITDALRSDPTSEDAVRGSLIASISDEGFDESPVYAKNTYVMQAAFAMHRVLGDTKRAIQMVESSMPSPDWRMACSAWLQRRVK